MVGKAVKTIRRIRIGEDRLFDAFNMTFLSIVLVIILFPLVFVVNASISDPALVTTGQVTIFPRGIQFDGYRKIFEYDKLWLGYRNTIMYTVLGTTLNIVVTIAAAYPLSRRDFAGRGALTFLLVFTMFFNGGLIPTYLLVRDLGLLNTIWAMVLPRLAMVWHIIIARTYLQSVIPNELHEAAKMDGCSNMRFLMSIVLPLSKPILAVITLYYAVYHWNTFFDALIYLSNDQLYPLQLVLRDILLLTQLELDMTQDFEEVREQRQFVEAVKYGIIIVASVPVLILYPFLQKFFVKGVMIGSLKG